MLTDSNKTFFSGHMEKWTDSLQQLFPVHIPEQATWTTPEAVTAVLNHLAQIRSSIVLFLPQKGDMPLYSVAPALEPGGLLSINSGDGSPYYLKPQQLTFEGFSEAIDARWAYFRLDTVPLSSRRSVSSDPAAIVEQVAELGPGQYQDFDGQHVPESNQIVNRILAGSFVIFAKGTPYTMTTGGTYQAAHNRVDGPAFRQVIQQQVLRTSRVG